MKYCRLMVSELNIEPDYLRPCCVGGSSVPSLPFTGSRIDMAAYRKFAYTALAMLQTDMPVCRPCNHVEERSGEMHPSMVENIVFKAIAINHHRNICNCRCVYCPYWDVPKEQKVPPRPILPVIQGLVRDRVVAPNCQIAWGGGEPTILGEFEEASRWILEKGYRQYIHTNAMRFSSITAKVLGEGRGKINLSLDSSDEASYNKVKGVNGWAKVTDTLAKYLRSASDPADVEVKYIIFEQNRSFEELERFLSLCADMGVRKVQYSFNGFEVSTGVCQEETLKAAAFFRHRGKELGLVCKPFYVDAPLMRFIDGYEKEMFGVE